METLKLLFPEEDKWMTSRLLLLLLKRNNFIN